MSDLSKTLLSIDIDVADIRYDFEEVNWGLLIQLVGNQGFSNEVIAEAAGVNIRTIYHWLNGNRPRDRDTGDRVIAMAFRWLPREKREKCGAVPF